MSYQVFQIKEIPDLTLGKYAGLAQSGVVSVLELNKAFLHQLYQKSIYSGVSFHLIYSYQKDLPKGEKLSIYLLAKGEEKALCGISGILDGTALSQYFRFEKAEGLPAFCYDFCTLLTKKEQEYEARSGKSYYSVPVWTARESGRLYGMLRMMEALGQSCVFRVDIKAESKSQPLRKALCSKPIPELYALCGSERDYGAEGLIRGYEELLQSIDGAPHFTAQVIAMSESAQVGEMLLSAAATEAIEKGSFNLSTYEGGFTPLSFIDGKECELYSISDTPLFVLNYKGGKVTLLNEEIECKDAKALSYLKNLFTVNELAPLFRFPCLYDGESISIRKESDAPPVTDENALTLGTDVNGRRVRLPLSLFPKHSMISGVPGSGKTNTMHHVTYSLWSKHKIPFLVLEPAKKEYRALLNLKEMEELRLFSPGSDTYFPLHINPFEFAKGLTVSEHIRTLCQVFEGAFPLESPMPFLLENAIEAVYRKTGWQADTRYTEDTDLEFPTMSMLYEELEQELEKTTYSGEVRGNLESALKVRIGSLLRREMGDVFDASTSTLTPEQWLTTPAIVELEAMGQGPANFLTLMLCSLIRECLKVNPKCEREVRHVLFIEEAHNLIGTDSQLKSGEGANAKTAATAFIVKMLAEVRALKEGVVIADQLPSALAQEVLKNTGIKIALRLTAADDRGMLCNSMSANSVQAEEMANFSTGEALLSYEKLQRPFKLKVDLWQAEDRDSKNDSDLAKLLASNKGYSDTLAKSVDVKFERLISLFEKLMEKQKATLEAVELCRNNAEYCKSCCTELDLLTERAQLLQQKLGAKALSDSEYVQLLSEITTQTEDINDAEKLLEKSLSVSEIEECASLISEFSQYVRTVASTLSYFAKLGKSFSDRQKSEFLKDTDTASVPKDIKKLIYMATAMIENPLNAAAILYSEVDSVYPLPAEIKDSIKKLSQLCGAKINFEF